MWGSRWNIVTIMYIQADREIRYFLSTSGLQAYIFNIWNALPNVVATSCSVSSFKRNIAKISLSEKLLL